LKDSATAERLAELRRKKREVDRRMGGPAGQKKLGRPLESDPFRRRRGNRAGYHTTSINLPLWAYSALLEMVDRGHAQNNSDAVTSGILLAIEHYGLGILVPTGKALPPGKPGEAPQRMYMDVTTKKRRKS
jgi:hypothetical protein